MVTQSIFYLHQVSSAQTTQRRNGLEQAARAFSTLNKVTPENRSTFGSMARQREEALINEANCLPPSKPSFGNRLRSIFKLILYSQEFDKPSDVRVQYSERIMDVGFYTRSKYLLSYRCVNH